MQFGCISRVAPQVFEGYGVARNKVLCDIFGLADFLRRLHAELERGCATIRSNCGRCILVHMGSEPCTRDLDPCCKFQEGAQPPAVPSHSRHAAQAAFDEAAINDSSEATRLACEP